MLIAVSITEMVILNKYVHYYYYHLRLRSNVCRGFGNDEDFLSACIVALFKIALIARKAFRTLLTMCSEYKFSFSVLELV